MSRRDYCRRSASLVRGRAASAGASAVAHAFVAVHGYWQGSSEFRHEGAASSALHISIYFADRGYRWSTLPYCPRFSRRVAALRGIVDGARAPFERLAARVGVEPLGLGTREGAATAAGADLTPGHRGCPGRVFAWGWGWRTWHLRER